MLAAENLAQSFNENHVLNGVNFSIPSGTITGLIGPSGGGKSVLLKVMGGILAPERGRIDYGVAEEDRQETEERCDTHCPIQDQVSLMFQEGALFDSLSVLDNVIFPLVSGRVPSMTLAACEREQVHSKAEEILARVGLTRAAAKFPGQLSGGMRRRVSLARALVSRPRILLLDDPTAGLDPIASGIIMALIAELHHEFKPTTVIVSHDLRRLLPMVENVLALFEGAIQFSGSVNELVNQAPGEVKHFVECRYDIGQVQ